VMSLLSSLLQQLSATTDHSCKIMINWKFNV